VIRAEELRGLAVVDETWTLDPTSKTLFCTMEITLLDSEGRVVFHSVPGSHGSAWARYTSILKDVGRDMWVVGGPTDEDLQEALEDVKKQLASQASARISAFIDASPLSGQSTSEVPR